MDAAACPQDIAYPTDPVLLNEASEKSEQLIDMLFKSDIHEKKPQTYRVKARKKYLQTAQKKVKSLKLIRKALGSQLGFLKRNPITGKFGQAKTGYSLNRIRARLQGTSETWIASIILVLNLVKLAGLGSLSLLINTTESFSAMTRLWVENLRLPFSAPASFLHVSLSSKSAA